MCGNGATQRVARTLNAMKSAMEKRGVLFAPQCGNKRERRDNAKYRHEAGKDGFYGNGLENALGKIRGVRERDVGIGNREAEEIDERRLHDFGPQRIPARRDIRHADERARNSQGQPDAQLSDTQRVNSREDFFQQPVWRWNLGKWNSGHSL